MNWFRRFMMGRYGGDQLSIALFIFSVLLTLVGRLAYLPILGLISYIPWVIIIFRALSRNIQRRQMENYKFSMLISPIYSRFKKIQHRIKKSRTHRSFKCPKCRAALWVPKGKGRIIITCPKCKTEFKKRT
jgi:hypothetical protein